MATQYDIFPFKLTKINPLNPSIDAITYVYDTTQIPDEPNLLSDIDPDANFTYLDGKLTRIDFTTGEYKTFTYISNPGAADDGLLNTLYDSVTATTKNFAYDVNGVLQSITTTT